MKSKVDIRRNLGFVSYFFYAFGLIFVLGGVQHWKANREFRGNAVSTDGVVQEKIFSGPFLTHPNKYELRINFVDEEEKVHILRVDVSPEEYRRIEMGDIIKITYNRKRPRKCIVGTTLQQRSAWMVFPIFGAFLLCFGIFWRLLVMVIPLPIQRNETSMKERSKQ